VRRQGWTDGAEALSKTTEGADDTQMMPLHNIIMSIEFNFCFYYS